MFASSASARSPRRVILASLVALGSFTLVNPGCSRGPRCATCGMTVDPTSRWYAEVLAAGRAEGCATPKCALRRLLGPGAAGRSLRVNSYYRQQRVGDDAVAFAVGSDILGPMGADLVPVELEFEAKFRAEHHATQMLRLSALTLALVEST